MKQDRSQWLGLFIGISLLIHVGAIYRSRAMPRPAPDAPPTSIEVALQPLPEVKTPASIPPASKNALKLVVHKAPAVHNPDHAPKSHVRSIAKATAVVPAVNEDIRTVHAPLPPLIRPTSKQPDANLGGLAKIQDERPLPSGVPSGSKVSAAPKLDHTRAGANLSGGGSPTQGPVAGGHGGAPTPETPPDDLVYNGGGAGGDKLPHTAPRIGGGGGKSILGVEDPLAKDAVPNDKPGIGPGKGGGQGQGAGAGVGTGRGAGIGTRPDAGNALSSLHSRPGSGIGAGSGTKIGAHAPGGGHGTGAELPGTGGSGYGYGRGKGIGIGDGAGIGRGVGVSGTGTARGVPFGDVAGLLGGTPKGGGGNKGGPGGTGRGSVFGARPGVGKGVLNVVYVLDCSGSMREGNKIGKAKQALMKAVSELKPSDTFNMLSFNGYVYKFSPTMLHATPEIVDAAMEWIGNRGLANHTNISGAMEVALSFSPINCVYLMSDGEPEGRETIHDAGELRAFVKQRNTQNAIIMTLALCLGEKYPGEEIMRGLAEDAGGDYNYVDLSKVQ